MAKREEFEHILRVHFAVKLAKTILLARHDDQRLPSQVIGLLRLLEQHVVVHVENARGALGALDVARKPEERFGDPRKHLSPLLAAPRYLCCRRPATN